MEKKGIKAPGPKIKIEKLEFYLKNNATRITALEMIGANLNSPEVLEFISNNDGLIRNSLAEELKDMKLRSFTVKGDIALSGWNGTMAFHILKLSRHLGINIGKENNKLLKRLVLEHPFTKEAYRKSIEENG